MIAAVLPGVGRALELVQRPIPTPGPREARIKVQACGVCGSDLFLQKGGFGADKLPVVPGHEASGVIDAVGDQVDDLKPGDQVALYYVDAEPDGRWARSGHPNLDPHLRRMGVDVDGAFAQYVVRPVHTLIRPPAYLDPPALALLTDAVATPYHALRLAHLQRGDRVLVLGVGGIGSNAVQLARHAGAEVVAASRSRDKLRLAQTLGASATMPISGNADADAEQLRDLGNGGFDVVIQCVGSALIDQLAIAVAGPAARVVLVGAATEPFRTRAVDLIWRELHVIGARGHTPEDIRAVIRLHLDGAISLDHLTASLRPLPEVNQALEDLAKRRVLRTVLLPHGDGEPSQ